MISGGKNNLINSLKFSNIRSEIYRRSLNKCTKFGLIFGTAFRFLIFSLYFLLLDSVELKVILNTTLPVVFCLTQLRFHKNYLPSKS